MWLILKLDESGQSYQADFYRRRSNNWKHTSHLYNFCHEQHHNGIHQAHNHARGSQPTFSISHELHTHSITIPIPQLPLHTPLDRSARIRYTFRSPTRRFPSPQASKMGSEQRIDDGQGGEILSFAGDGEGNVRGARTVLPAPVSFCHWDPRWEDGPLIWSRYTIYYPFEKVW